MSLDDVAKVTKIQPRILERLEAGRLEGLPAEVFVRGFVRSFARCVGLDEREALQRYAACAPTVRALVEAMADLAPGSATAARATPRKMAAVEVIDLAGPVLASPVLAGPVLAGPVLAGPVLAGPVLLTPPAEPEAPSVAPSAATTDDAARVEPPGSPGCLGACAESDPPVATTVEAPAPELPGDRDASAASPADGPDEPIASSEPVPAADALAADAAAADAAFSSRKKKSRRRRAREAALAREAEAAESEHAADVPREPLAVETPGATAPVTAPSAPWRRLARRVSAAPAAPARPSLVIDDADPESAERVQEERAEHTDTLAPRRSFLPPILLDREDRSARQGGLTLAVILLLIAATLTLSYLMRRPSASGDGMTGREAPVQRAQRG